MTYDDAAPITVDALKAYSEMSHSLLQRSDMAHRLVTDRQARLRAVDPHMYLPNHPIPEDAYEEGDDYYSDVEVGSTDIYYKGTYVVWDEPGKHHQEFANISVPFSLFIDPNGEALYEAETVRLVAEATAKVEASNARISALVDEAVALGQKAREQGATSEEAQQVMLGHSLRGLLDDTKARGQ